MLKKGGNLGIIKVYTDHRLDWVSADPQVDLGMEPVPGCMGPFSSWSTTEPSTALPSGEAEYSAFAKAAAGMAGEPHRVWKSAACPHEIVLSKQMSASELKVLSRKPDGQSGPKGRVRRRSWR